MNEKQLEKKLVRYCKEHDILCYKFVSPGCRGVPDRLLIRKGKVLFVELKSPGQKPTALQEREIDRIHSAGIYALWESEWHSIEQSIRFCLFGLCS